MDNDFLYYDRITDTMMYLSPDIKLEFVVNLAYKRRDGGRQFFHSEYEKTSSYRMVDISRTVRRTARYYYAINLVNNYSEGIALKHADVYILVTTIEKRVLPWFFSKDRIFKIIDNRLAIVGEYEPYFYTQSEYKFISIIPIIREFEDGSFKEGVRMFIGNKDYFCDLTIDEFLGFYHLLANTDMYVLASTMMNYVKIPPYGVNGAGGTFSRAPGLGSGRFSGHLASADEDYDAQTNVVANDAKSFLDSTKTTNKKGK